MQRHLKLISDFLKGKPVKLRSPQWHKVERAHLVEEPACGWCASTKELQVHHIEPFHIDPSKELDDRNLITLCEEGGSENCHLIHGHNGDWKSFNPNVRVDCVEHRKQEQCQENTKQ